VRSGAVAFGKEANGHPPHAGVPPASTRPADGAPGRRPTDGAVSRPQMKAQAAQSHRKVSGSSVAVAFRRVERLKSIGRIIRGAVGVCHARSMGRAFSRRRARDPAEFYLDTTGAVG
jgi:hypothetical protein